MAKNASNSNQKNVVRSSAAPGNEDSSVPATKLPLAVHHQQPVLNQSDGTTDRVFLSSVLSFPLFCWPVISNRTENETDNQSTQSQSQTHTIKREDSVPPFSLHLISAVESNQSTNCSTAEQQWTVQQKQ